MNPDRFELRHAGGLYWLLDVSQEGPEYKRPVAINVVGADIYIMIKEGKNKEEIITQLMNKYEADEKSIRDDVESFMNILMEAVSEKKKG